MNLQKGFERLTLVLAILISSLTATSPLFSGHWLAALVSFAIIFMLVWLVYFLIKSVVFFVRGFLGKD